jgi:hypothetical protein
MNKILLLSALALIALGGCSKIDLQPQNAESTHTHK